MELNGKGLTMAEEMRREMDTQKSMDERADERLELEELYKGKDLLTDIEDYLKSGIHIGTRFKSGEMKRYIFKKRRDGLQVFNIETIDKRIRLVAKMLAKYEGKDIAIICRRLYGHQPAKKFAAMIGAKQYTGRFIPGSFTNPQARAFFEPKIILICDPITDYQALKESSEIGIPALGIVGSDSPMKNLDLVIPANNKGRKSLALIFYLLTREVLVERKELDRAAFTPKISDFEQEIDETALSEDRMKKRSFSRDGPSRGGSRSGGSRGGSGGRSSSGGRGGSRGGGSGGSRRPRRD